MTGGEAAGGEAAGGLRVPFRRWRRWVRSLRRRTALVRSAESGGDPHDRVYLAYGVVLLGLVYGPILWSAVAQAAVALDAWAVTTGLAGRADGGVVAALLAGGLPALGLASAAGLAAARAGGPLWVSPVEATFVLGGQFPPHTVLRRRGVALALGVAALGAFGATALATGAGAVPREVLGWGLVGATAAQVPLAVGVAAQAPRWRRAAWAAAGTLLGLGGLGALAAARGGGEPQAVLVAGRGVPGDGSLLVLLVASALVAAACVALVLRALPGEVDVDEAASGYRRTATAGRGLVGGESGGMSDLLGARRYAGRRATLARGLLRWAPVAARDVLGLRRRPGAAVTSFVVACAAGLLVLRGADGRPGAALLAVGGAAILYATTSTWADGLRALATQPEPGRLLPGSPARLLGAHLVTPAVIAVAAAGLALGAAAALGWAGAGAGPALFLVVVTAVATRAWVAGSTAAPPGLFTPMMTPNGDMSMLVLGAWYLRGWLVVAAVAWLLWRVGPGAGAGSAVLVAALSASLVYAAAGRLARG